MPPRSDRENPAGTLAGGKLKGNGWKWAALAAVVMAPLVWLGCTQLTRQSFDWGLFAASLEGVRWEWMALATLLLYVTYAGRALRWAVLLAPVQPHPRFTNLLSSTVIGFAALTLFGRPGEIVRPYLISVKERVPLASQLAAWFLERICDLLMALLVFGFALARVHASHVQVGPRMAWVLQIGGEAVAAMCVLLLGVLLVFRHFSTAAQARIKAALAMLPETRRAGLERLLDAFVQGVEATRSDRAMLLLLFYSILEWVFIAACYWCIARSFRGTLALSLEDILIYMGFVSFGALVQVPGIGGGVQVVSIVVLTELFGMRLEVAAGYSLFVWIITFVVIVPVGLVWALRDGLNWQGLRRIGREVKT